MAVEYMGNLRLVAAWIQCGEEPPYEMIAVPTRTRDGYGEIEIKGKWVALDVKLERFDGKPVAGIAEQWGL